jgi:hypothetical protein
MTAERKNLHLDIVTSSPARSLAFQMLLGPDRVRQVQPLFTEDVMRKPVSTVESQPAEWPMQVAEHKAFQDLAAHIVNSYLTSTVEEGRLGDIKKDDGRLIRIYSDTVNIAYAGDTSDSTAIVLEKPKNLAQWLADSQYGAMSMSGKNFEICTALTAIDMTDPSVHPTTTLVRIAGKMKPFTIADVKTFISKYGEDAVLKSASGISFINTEADLFETSEPLKIYIQKDTAVPPSLLLQYPTWEHIGQKERIRILYGAIPEVVSSLSENFTPSYPQGVSQGRKI